MTRNVQRQNAPFSSDLVTGIEVYRRFRRDGSDDVGLKPTSGSWVTRVRRASPGLNHRDKGAPQAMDNIVSRWRYDYQAEDTSVTATCAAVAHCAEPTMAYYAIVDR